MSVIKKLNYMEVEILKDVKDLFDSLNKALITNGKFNFDGIVVLGENKGTGVVIDHKEENDSSVVIRIEFSKLKPSLIVRETNQEKVENDNDDYIMAKKFYLQIDKSKLEGQTILYQDYLDKDQDLELVDDYNDARLYEELNILLREAVLNYFDKEQLEVTEPEQESKDVNSEPF